jgi:hypothetical protein
MRQWQIGVDFEQPGKKGPVKFCRFKFISDIEKTINAQPIVHAHAEMDIIMGKVLIEQVRTWGITRDQINISRLENCFFVLVKDMTIALGHKVHPREWADYILIFRNPVESQI